MSSSSSPPPSIQLLQNLNHDLCRNHLEYDGMNRIWEDVKMLVLNSKHGDAWKPVLEMVLSRVFGENITEVKFNDDIWQSGPSYGWLSQSSLSSSERRKITSSLLADSTLVRSILDTISPPSMHLMCGKTFPWKVVMKALRVLPDDYSTLNSTWVFRRFVENKVSNIRDWSSIELGIAPSDYLLVNLVRYPVGVDTLSLPQRFREGEFKSRMDALNTLKKKGEREWIRDSPYLEILDSYFDAFIYSSQASSKPNSTEVTFLRLCCEFWMDIQPVVQHCSGHTQVPDHTTVEVVEDKGVYREFAGLKEPCLQCIYLLLKHLLSRPGLAEQYKEIQQGKCNFTLTDLHDAGKNTLTTMDAAYYGQGGGRVATKVKCQDACTSPALMQIVQQPLFDLLRSIFYRRRSNSGQGDTKIFYFAVEIWLAWIQPWKFQRSSYSNAWRPYIVANMHMYTTLHAMFLTAMAEFEVGNTEQSTQTYVDVLRSVRKVFGEQKLASDINDICSMFDEFRTSPYFLAEVRHVNLCRSADGTITGEVEQIYSADDVKQEIFTLHAAHVALFPAERGTFHHIVLDVAARSKRTTCGEKSVNQSLSEILATLYEQRRGSPQKLVEFFGVDSTWTETPVCSQIRALYDDLGKQDTDLQPLFDQRKGLQGIVGAVDSETAHRSRPRDNLKSPFLSCEWPFVPYTIALSQSLNSMLGLPGKRVDVPLSVGSTIDDAKASLVAVEGVPINLQELYILQRGKLVGGSLSGSCNLTDLSPKNGVVSLLLRLHDSNCQSWWRILGSPTEWKDLSKALNRMRMSFRINLRFLAHIRTSCILCLLVAHLCTGIGWISISSCSTLLLVLVVPLYYGSFSFFPFRHKNL